MVAVDSKRALDGQTSQERRYYICSGPNHRAEALGETMRRHWSVENELHWVLDAGNHEDLSRVRNPHAAANLARVRRVALSMLKQDKSLKPRIQGRRLKAAWDGA